MKWFGVYIATAFIMLLIGALFHVLIPFVAPSIETEYGNAALFRPWDGWTQYYMIVHPIGVSFLFTFVFTVLQQSQGPAGLLRRRFGGLVFGFGLFVIGSLPVFLLNFASFQVSANIIIAWAFQNCVQYTVAGMFLSWLYRSGQTIVN